MPKQLLTGDHFYRFFQCPHWIWYDIYEDSKKRKEASPLLDLIYKGKMSSAVSLVRPHKKFEELKPELFKDLEEGFLATLELMKHGKNIYHGILMHENWVGMPDLLEARALPSDGQAGKSNLGEWHYVVYDIQNSLNINDGNKFQLVFYSLILEKIQGVRPKEAYVIDPQGNERSFLIDDFIDQFHITRGHVEKILAGEKPPPFLKSGCRRTPWYSICMADAQDCNDVSLIYSISQADQRRLYNIGMKTVTDIADADVEELRIRLEDWSFDKIVRFSNQAKALVSNESIVLRKNEFPKVDYEIYFDIESDPTRDIDYLFGFLVKDMAKSKGEYKYFLAKDKSEERIMWTKFLDFLGELDSFVIYYYTNYEIHVFDRLVLRYGAPSSLISKFKENVIDLNQRVVDSVVLPLYFYTLKDVAGYIGYKWNDPKAGGAESVVWYDEWLKKKSEKILERILKYNEDDVRATLLIKEWLEKQKPKKVREKLDA